MSTGHSAEKETRSERVEIAARALHRHVCGDEWDEWNNPCSWAGEDAEPGLKSYPVCCEVDLSDLAGAVVDALSARPLPPASPLPLHRTEAGYPSCSTCDGGGCLDCTDPA